jgi:hypothetical protein
MNKGKFEKPTNIDALMKTIIFERLEAMKIKVKYNL